MTDYCHKMGVANRDIKLENTLLDGSPKPLVKITDFGYCKSDQESLPKSKVGTPGYTGQTRQTFYCISYSCSLERWRGEFANTGCPLIRAPAVNGVLERFCLGGLPDMGKRSQARQAGSWRIMLEVSIACRS